MKEGQKVEGLRTFGFPDPAFGDTPHLKFSGIPADTNSMDSQVLSRTVRVALADDHPLVRQGLRAVLEYSEVVELVAEAANGVELINEVAAHRPDVVLVDIEMKPMDGLEAVRRIRRQFPEIRALMLSAHRGGKYFDESIRAGAAGYLSKTISPDELVRSILAVASGEATVYPGTQEASGGSHRINAWGQERSTAGLTPREVDVLKLVAAGKSNKEIARMMGIGMQTVKTHVSHILAKMGAPDRAGAVAIGFRKGIFE